MAAPRKRKRKSTSTNPRSNKRRKQQADDSELYSAKEIKKEKYEKGKRFFLVQWDGKDPKTNKNWEPSWIEEEWATAALIEEWEEQKKDNKVRPLKRQKRPVIESSQPTAAAPFTPEPSIRAQSTLSQPSTGTSSFPKPGHPSPEVRIPPLRSSFDRNEHLVFSSQTVNLPHGNFITSSQSSTYSGPRDYLHSGYCRDSEDEEDEGKYETEIDGSASYVPTTQEASGAGQTQQASSSTPSQELSDSLSNPPRSVAETDPDAVHQLVEDSQPQACEEKHIPEDKVIPDTFETVESTLHTVSTASGGHIVDDGDRIVSTSQPEIQVIEEFVTAGADVTDSGKVPGPEEAALRSSNEAQLSAKRLSHDPDEETPQVSDEQNLLHTDAETFESTEAEAAQLVKEEILLPTEAKTVQPAGKEPSSSIEEPLHTEKESFRSAGEGTTQSTGQEDNSHQSRDFAPQPVEGGGAAQHAAPRSTRAISRLEALTKNTGGPKPVSVFEIVQPSPAVKPETHDESDSNTAHTSKAQADINLTRGPVVSPNCISIQSSRHTASPIGSWPAEQYAQLVPAENCSSTQNDGTQTVFPTVEKRDCTPSLFSPQPRHDSSQQTPETADLTTTLSPVPDPPLDSLGTLSSNVPGRPRSPTALMDSYDEGTKKVLAEQNLDHSFTPPPRRMLEKLNDNRSPSAIPAERPIAPTIPSALRTVVIANSVAAETGVVPAAPELGPNDVADETPSVTQDDNDDDGKDDNNDHNNGHDDDDDNPVSTLPSAPASVDNEEPSDMDDSESLLNDDLELQSQEFIVPLSMEGRQAGIYKDEFRSHIELLDSLLDQPESFHDFDKVQDVLDRLGWIETHVDLLYNEPSPTQTDDPSLTTLTQLQHQTKWSYDNSVKFKFLGSFLDAIKDRDINMVLVIEKNDKRLLTIVDSFLRGTLVNLRIPMSGVDIIAANPASNVSVTVLSSEENTLVQPPVDLVVLLDGSLDAKQIRKKNWASGSGRSTVPLLHLVIPRATGHVERYVSKALAPQRRLHTIIATLTQFRDDSVLGRAIHTHNPNPQEAAHAVAQFLVSREQDPGSIEWPLPSIGSIKDLVEFQSQLSQEAMLSSPSQAPTAKRPLEDDQPHHSKRMRYTPQQHLVDPNNEITHVTDSMPGTAADALEMRARIEHLEKELAIEQDKRRMQEKRSKQDHMHWEQQQNRHEEFSRTYASLKKEREVAGNRLEAAARTETNLREQLSSKKDEILAMQIKLKELQDLHTQSEDVKAAEITRLGKVVEDAKESERRALKSKVSTEKDLEYIKDQYQKAQAAAREAQDENDELKKQLTTFKKQDPKQVSELGNGFYKRGEKLAAHKEVSSAALVKMLKKQLESKEQENARLKAGRGVGAGTRAQSVGPRTRPSSRAASPLPTNRDRLTNLRNVG
ncbi:unnamed protein product [Periconia digitata]|uniref:Chromo domain-containing protein n=1 Tax=Periconia digitata TaxID=1303443 RepID=A0A9W4U8J9_9PLEO|nr:unnamed protein product [Periconia digitata]